MEKPQQKPEEKEIRLIRILSKDIRGDKNVYSGLTSIKGISWAISNALCRILKLDKKKKIQDLSKEEIEKISNFLNNPQLPNHLLNRRKDRDSGEDKHLYGADLDLQKDFDIKILKKIKCYKGMRHTAGQPVRGQRTKSHFRKNKKKSGGVGVNKKGAKK